MKTHVIVTGGGGQLATSIQAVASEAFEYRFCRVDEMDITDARQVDAQLAQFKPSVMINCAAYTAVDQAESDTQAADLINRDALLTLSQACNQHQVKLIHISTDFVYDDAQPLLKHEESPTNPLGQYAASKLAGEEIIRQTCHDYLIIRTSWLYSGFGKNFYKTMHWLASEDKAAKVISDQFGTPTHALDLAVAIQQIMLHQHFSQTSGTFNFSNLGSATWYDFAFEIFQFLEKSNNITPIPTKDYPTPAIRPKFTVMDKTKINRTFDLQIPHWKTSLTAELLRHQTQVSS